PGSAAARSQLDRRPGLQPQVIGAAEGPDLPVVDRAGEVGEQGVVDVVGALGAHLTDVVDDLGDLVPGGHDRRQQRAHGAVGDGRRVTGVEDRAAVHEVADVGDARDVRVDHGVQLAVHRDVKAGGREGVTVPDRVHAPGEGRGELLG